MAECPGVGHVLGAHQFLGKYPEVSAFALNILLTLLWFLTVTNAVQFLDGMDGLAAGLGVIAGLFFSVTALQSTTSKSTGVTPNMQVTVQGPYDRTSAQAAVQSLGDSLIAWANKYQTAKIDALTAQIATDKATIATLQQTLTTAQNQLKALGGSGMSSWRVLSISRQRGMSSQSTNVTSKPSFRCRCLSCVIVPP